MAVVTAQDARRAAVPAVMPAFADRTTEAGLDFVHINGATGELLLPEVIGAGGALFDYDNDGDLDLFAVQSGPLRRGTPGGGALPRSRLFRNDLSEAGRLRFTDVTERSGIVATGYGMGAAVGDIDNDGWVDVYLTGLGAAQMLHNNGNGTFSDITTASRTADTRWSTSASFLDYDADGWLDLFVVHYVNFGLDMKRGCFSAGSARDYCNPSVYDAVPARLLHNERDGTFSDVSARAGLAKVTGRGLGVLVTDVNGDSWPDLYVANDGDPNHLWMNERGSGRFTDEALLAGVALNRMGQAQGSMGIDSGDVDGDGDEDFFVTNLDNEGDVFYRQVEKGLFEDRTVEAGLFQLGLTGFGTRLVDYDNDGWLDVIAVNGAVRHLAAQVRRGDPYPLRQRSQLFWNDGRGRFVEMSREPAFSQLQVGRGLAAGDLDNDGGVDVALFNNNGPARVLMNQIGSTRHWLGVRVLDRRHPRDALQARVTLLGGAGRTTTRVVHTDGSYASASDPRLVFGLGADAGARSIRVQWPGGSVEEFRGLAVDRYWVLEAGKPARIAAGARK
jgi:hypothetical protein